MMKSRRHLVSMHSPARIAVMSLAAMTLAFSAVCRADDAAAGSAEAAAAGPAATAPVTPTEAPVPNVASPRVSHRQPGGRLTAAQSIDESVRRLTHGLDLNPGQQDRLRQILVDQHRQMMQLRSGGSAASGDVTTAMLSIYDQTRARIRAMLTDEQREKYPAAVPRDQTAPGQADLHNWMQMQETKRKQDNGAPQ